MLSFSDAKWLFKLKQKFYDSVSLFKLLFVSQGHKHVYDINYFDTFSLFAKLPSTRILLATLVNRKWGVQQLYVSNSFLDGTIDTAIYMQQPTRFVDKKFHNHVFLLKKALYVLKQALKR